VRKWKDAQLIVVVVVGGWKDAQLIVVVVVGEQKDAQLIVVVVVGERKDAQLIVDRQLAQLTHGTDSPVARERNKSTTHQR
jgi:predicted Mrr-cat superfamily restriction endonuclease